MATFGEMIGRAYSERRISNLSLRDAHLHMEHLDAAMALDRLTDDMIARMANWSTVEDGKAEYASVTTLSGWLKALSAPHAQRLHAAMAQAVARIAAD